MEMMPLPPQPPTDLPRPERKGAFERWFKKRKKNAETLAPEKTEDQKTPESKPQKTSRRLAHNVLRLFAQETPLAQTPEAPRVQERVELEETAEKTRTIGRATLRFVRGLLGRERAPDSKESANSRVLKGAEADLGGALNDLGEAMEGLASGDQDTKEPAKQEHAESPARQEQSVASAGITEGEPARLLPQHSAEIAPLLETKEKLTAALAVAGLGVVAVGATVLLVLESRHAAQERRRFERAAKKDSRLLEAQEAQLREQQEALERLRAVQQGQTAPQPRYYQRVGEFTHQQADVTRAVAREVREFTHQQPNPPERQPVASVSSPEFTIPRQTSPETPVNSQSNHPEKPATEYLPPIIKTEQSDRLEQSSGTTNTAQQGGAIQNGGLPASGTGPVLSTPQPHVKTHQAAQSFAVQRQAALRQRKSWIVWSVAAVIVIAAVVWVLMLL